MKKTLTAAAALAVAASLFAAACGSSGTTTSTNASEAVTWATSLCSATTTWQQALKDAASAVKADPTRAGLSAAADKAKSATEDYVSALSDLGTPATTAGDQAKAELDALKTQLQDQVATMKDAAKGASPLTTVSLVSGTLAQMGQQIEKTFQSLQSKDPKGELQQAFRQTDACAPYAA